MSLVKFPSKLKKAHYGSGSLRKTLIKIYPKKVEIWSLLKKPVSIKASQTGIES